MSERKPATRKEILDWWSRFPWHEHHIGGEPQYDREDHDWSAEELEELRQLTRVGGGPSKDWHIPLYLDTVKVGTISLSPKRLLAAVTRALRERDELTSERTSKSGSGEASMKAVQIVAAILDEAFYESDLPNRLLREVSEVAPLLEEGPAGVPKILEFVHSVEDLMSRRLLRALSAIGWANTFQKTVGGSPQHRRQEIASTQPQRLAPTGVSTAALVRKFRSVLEVGAAGPTAYRRSGRPPKLDRSLVPRLLANVRSQLAPLHARLRRRHSPLARRQALQDYPELSSRLDSVGLTSDLVRSGCPPLEVLACRLLGLELGASPHTIRRYGRASATKSRRE